MERKVIYRDRQEMTAADLNNVETFVDEGLQHIVSDAISGERHIVGLEVTQHSATEIEVALGRLWDGSQGKVFRKDMAEVISVFSYLPLQDKKILSVSILGQEAETDIQPRDFLIDVQTEQTEPRSVAMESVRNIVITLTAGAESSDPQPPAVPTGYTELAQVVLNSSGIESITLNVTAKLPNLHLVNQRLIVVENWKAVAEPQLATLASDLAALAKKLAGMGGLGLINELAADVGRLKELANLPDSYVGYGQDYFLDTDESNVEDENYYARVEEGIRFPWAGQDQSQPALYNPLETKVAQYTGFMLPKFAEEIRLATSGYSGPLAISSYQYQTFTLKKGNMAITRRRYGPTRSICTNVRAYGNDPEAYVKSIYGDNVEVVDYRTFMGFLTRIRFRYYWEDTANVAYQYWAPTEEQISGSLLSQTIMNSQNGWLSSLGFYFPTVAATGDVHLAICETKDGEPDLSKTLISTTVSQADLKTYPEETKIVLPRPVFLEAGKRYAFAFITPGAHEIATVSGHAYTQGTLFYSMDGLFFQGDFTKDLLMNLYYAKFTETYVTVQMEPASLSGGIADIDLELNAVIPDNTQLAIEYQREGVWYSLEPDTYDQLLNLPAMCALRMSFIGSTTLMPAVDVVGSHLTVSRPATTFKHISTTRTLASATDSVTVQALLEDFDSEHHTCTIKLITDPDGSPTVVSPDAVEDKTDPDGIRRVATFSSISGVTEYQVQIEGTTDTALVPFLVAERVDIAS